MRTSRPLVHCRPHDYANLVRRWRKLSRAARLVFEPFAEAAGYPIYWCRTRTDGDRCVYLSAGIHGDEAGSTEGLLAWAEANIQSLRSQAFVIFPCLNPWGLQNNIRFDAEHRDLNRCYNHDSVTQIAAQKRVVAGKRFSVAVALHEDYDATGVYIYEIQSERPHWSERLLEQSARFIPPEQRRYVDGRRCDGGVIRRRIRPDLMPNHPEAFFLHFHHANRTLTIETPSEFDIDARAAAHAAILEEVVRLAFSNQAMPG